MLSHFHCSSERWERSFSCWGFAWGLVLSCLLAGHIGACLLRPSCPQWPNSAWTLCLDLPCTVLPEFSLIFPASDILYCFPSCGLAALWPEAQFCSLPHHVLSVFLPCYSTLWVRLPRPHLALLVRPSVLLPEIPLLLLNIYCQEYSSHFL